MWRSRWDPNFNPIDYLILYWITSNQPEGGKETSFKKNKTKQKKTTVLIRPLGAHI